MGVGLQLDDLLADGFALLFHLEQQQPVADGVHAFVALAHAVGKMFGDIFQLLVEIVEEYLVLFVRPPADVSMHNLTYKAL